jgi:hypothetical protein
VPELDNAAARLHYWFKQASEAAPEIEQRYKRELAHRAAFRKMADVMGLTQRQEPPTVVDLWYSAWEIDRSGVNGVSFNYFQRISHLAQALGEVEAACKDLPAGYHPDLLLSGFDKVRQVVNSSWAGATGKLVAASDLAELLRESLPVLARLDQTLSSRQISNGVSVSQMRDLRNQINSLIDEVKRDENLGDELKDLIVTRLKQVLTAISQAYVLGDAPLKEAAEALLGAVRLDPELWNRVSESRWGPRVAAVWLGLMATLGGVGAVPALLPHSEPTPPAIQTPVPVDVRIDVDVNNPDGDSDVIDAELVDDPEAPARSEQRQPPP